jgi:hypothetical protein
MSRIAKRSAVTLLVALLGVVLAPAVSHGQGGTSPLVPPQSNAFGKSFEEWNGLQTEYAITAGLGEGPAPSDTVGRVRLFPGEFDPNNPDSHFDITLPPGTPFVAAPFFIFGERYDNPNVPDDDPFDPATAKFLKDLFDNAKITTVLDGQVLLDGTATGLFAQFGFGPVFFDEPIVYAEPQPRGVDLNATAALWVMGIGSVYQPLPVGEHTLVHDVKDFFLPPNPQTFKLTYDITVSPH